MLFFVFIGHVYFCFEKCLLSSFVCLFNVFWLIVGLVFWAPCIYYYSLLRWFSKIFFHFVDCLFSLVTASFAVQKLCTFMQSHLSIIYLKCWAFGALFRKLLLMSVCSSAFLILSWIDFTIVYLTLRVLIHFELTLMQGERLGSSLSFPQVDIQFSQHHLLKRLFLHQWTYWGSLSKIKWAVAVRVYVWVFYSVPLFFAFVFCYYHAGFIAVVLQCSLKPGIVIPSPLLFLLRIGLSLLFFCASIWTVKLIVLSLWRMPHEFLWKLHWLHQLILMV
jgi:hypothetical protein